MVWNEGEGDRTEDLEEGRERVFSYRRVLYIYKTPLVVQQIIRTTRHFLPNITYIDYL